MGYKVNQCLSQDIKIYNIKILCYNIKALDKICGWISLEQYSILEAQTWKRRQVLQVTVVFPF